MKHNVGHRMWFFNRKKTLEETEQPQMKFGVWLLMSDMVHQGKMFRMRETRRGWMETLGTIFFSFSPNLKFF